MLRNQKCTVCIIDSAEKAALQLL